MEKIYVFVAIVVLAIIGLLITFNPRHKKEKKSISPLSAIAFACVIAGIVFGNNRIVGYSFFGAGIILAIVDMVKKSQKKTNSKL